TTAMVGRAVEIAGAIEDQPGQGGNPVRAAAEVMQHLLRPAPTPCGHQLEHCTVVVSTAAVGRAEEIAGGIDDQPSLGTNPVRAAAEAMQHLLRPGPAR